MDDVTRLCAQCGNPLSATAAHNAKYCSKRCSNARWGALPYRPPTFTCTTCGATKATPQRGPVPKYCSDSCRSNRGYLNARADGRYAAHLAERRAEKAAKRPPCANCGGPVANSRAKYCSARECSLASKRARARAVYQANPQAGRDRMAAVRSEWSEERRAEEVAKHRARTRINGRAPSAVAADALRQSRMKAAIVETFSPMEIFERDGWRCGICSELLDPSAFFPHPQSPSIDHIVPLSKGGEHSRANVRAAHLRCNVRRGNRAPSSEALRS